MIKKGQHKFQYKIRELKNETKDNLFLDDLKVISKNFINIDLKRLD
ncbi:hypothetical protein METP3_02416 [Methanosarcinales archaeon]|nr:hypothetical protein METP3_02416 [Methanosarcinales archaeon]